MSDVLPLIGDSDDDLAITFALATAQMYITDEVKVKAKAKKRIREILGDKFVFK